MMLDRTKKRWRQKRCQMYQDMLLSNKIRLRDIPENYRLSKDCGNILHIIAFRADRGVSKERYMEDLAYLDWEIAALPDGDFKKRLRQLYQDEERMLFRFDKQEVIHKCLSEISKSIETSMNELLDKQNGFASTKSINTHLSFPNL